MALAGSKRLALYQCALAIGLCAVVFAVLRAGDAPSPVPASAPPTEFSAERAIKHIQSFAVEPHPAGTPANDKVREYILGALAEIGVDAEVVTVKLSRGYEWLSEVSNVLARIPGKANTKAFALMAHYDSTPYGPGADDGSGVATMIETARAIKAGPPLMNDVMLVFTDAEERGLVGARAFAEHPWAKQVGVLMNMETRGTLGPSGMFETTQDNGWLIRQLINSGAPFRGTSLGYDIYRRMPTRTDLSVLKQSGFQAYNIAFLEDFPNYHTPNDNAGNVSLNSLQHDGAYALSLARYLGNMPLNNIPREADTIFFNVFGSATVRYPASFGWPLAVVAAVAFICAAWFGVRRGRLTVRGIARGSGLVIGATIVVVVVTAAILALAYWRHYIYILYDTRRLVPLLAGITVVAAGICFRASTKRVATPDLVAGSLALWVIAMFVVQVAFPHGAYVALWPLVAGSLGLLLLVTGRGYVSGWRVWVHALFGIPAIVLVAPFVRGTMASLTVMTAPLLMVPVVLLLGLLAPQVRYFFNPLPKRNLVAAIVVICIILYFSVSGAGGPKSPRMNSVSYGLDRATGRAWWMSTDDKPDEWTSQFFPDGTPKMPVGEFVPYERKPLLKAPAPVAELPAPTVEVLSDAPHADGSREVSLRVTSKMGVPELKFEIDPPVRVLEVSVDGQEFKERQWHRYHDGWTFYYEIFPRSGTTTINLLLRDGGTVSGRIWEKWYELPPLPYTPRPPYMINKPNSLDWFEKNKMTSGSSFVVTPFQF